MSGLIRDEQIDLPYGAIVVRDWMGGDEAVVQSARISYGAGTKTVREDRGLIRYLMRKRHTSPFEQCELKLLIRCPMDVWRQWIRHRTASVNEYSTRYSEAIDQALTTEPGRWRAQAQTNRQGSGGNLPQEVGEQLSRWEGDLHARSRFIYQHRIESGVAREQARKDLPLSTFTEAYWKIDLHNLLHFLELRLDSYAQLEIRTFAEAIAGLVQRWCPLTWAAFVDYRLEAVTFSRGERILLARILEGAGGGDVGLSEREETEFREKLTQLRKLI